MDTFAKAIEELEAIEIELAKLSTLQRRRDQLRQFIDIGRALYQSPVQSREATTPSANASLPSAKVWGSAKNQIIDGAKRLISERGPLQTSELVRLLEASGVSIGGVNKALNVSVVLSRAKDDFKSDRSAGGWTLIQARKEEPPQGVDAPAGV